MVSGSVQGGSGEILDQVEVVVQRPLVGFQGFAFRKPFFPFRVSFGAFLGIHEGAEHGGFPAPPIFGRDPTAPADGTLQTRSAVAVDQRHGYYAPWLAPFSSGWLGQDDEWQTSGPFHDGDQASFYHEFYPATGRGAGNAQLRRSSKTGPALPREIARSEVQPDCLRARIYTLEFAWVSKAYTFTG